MMPNLANRLIKPPVSLQKVNWVSAALADINSQRRQILHDCGVLEPCADFVLSSEGKRIRPLLVLCFAHLDSDIAAATPAHYRAAAAIELLHEASLVHDDILDSSVIRRDRETLGEHFDIARATYAGGFITSTCIAIIAEHDARIPRVLGKLLKELVYAQLMEELPTPDCLAVHQKRSEDIMLGKTGAMFELAIRLGLHLAVGNDRAPMTDDQAADFARHFSLAFQIRDDLADLTNDAIIRKPGGNDLVQGNPTWPFLVWAHHQGNYEAAWARLRHAKGDAARAEALQNDIIAAGTEALVAARVIEEIEQARQCLAHLPDSDALHFIHSLLDRITP